MLKKNLSLLLLFLVVLIFPKSIFAQDFSFDYDVTYEVNDTGSTQVIYNVIITNLQSQLYAQNYVLTVAFKNLVDITASDIFGSIKPQINNTNGQTNIQLNFTQPVVGINQKHSFFIKFKTKDIATKNGRIWEILIPGTQITPEINSYNIKLLVPKSFGQPAYFSPPTKTFAFWTLSQHQGQGISVAYGDFQAFDLRLKYHLKNEFNYPILKEITLLPDTTYQKVIYKRISVLPDNVLVDADGNHLALYLLKAKETKDIEFEAQSHVYFQPQNQKVTLTNKQIDTYTKSLPFWDLDQDNLSLLNNLNSVHDIYDYTVRNLVYDYNRVSQKTARQGANKALINKNNAVCLEFSDLFVALARAKKIPARAIHGYAYTTNPQIQPLSLTADILHAWAEYYDHHQQSWIQVDPTWGNTTHGVDYFSKLDFNHIAFAILGSQSDYPYPAGAFRGLDDTKTVYVDFSRDLVEPTPSLNIQARIPNLTPGKPQIVYIQMKNNGNVSAHINHLQLQTPISKTFKLDIDIPPYGKIQFPVILKAPLMILPQNQQFIFSVNGEQFTQEYRINSLFFNDLIFAGIVIILGLMTLILIIHEVR